MDLHVMLAIDDRYVGGAAVVAHSIRRALRDPAANLVLHVVDCHLSEDARATVAGRLGRYGEVHLRPAPGRFRLRGEDRLWYSDAAQARLEVTTIIPPDVPRVLYLDSDVLVLEDITALYTADLRGGALGAVLNGFAPSRSIEFTGDGVRQLPTGATPPGHFNSGVLLMDLERWRDEDITGQAMSLYRRFGAGTTHFDQDLLNHLFAGTWVPLDKRWNKVIAHPVLGDFGAGRLDELTRREGIVHYIGRVKPWHDEFPDNALKQLYAEYSDEALV